jgi:hypothetical protein
VGTVTFGIAIGVFKSGEFGRMAERRIRYGFMAKGVKIHYLKANKYEQE